MRRQLVFYMLFLVCVATFVSGEALAKSFKGVNFPDFVIVGDKKCELNGIGIRKKFFIEVYYGALYLPYKSSDAKRIVQDNVPKAVIMHVVYKKIGPKKWVEGWKEAFEDSVKANTPGLKEKIEKFLSFFDEPVVRGGEVFISYDPRSGTEVKINGKLKGIVEGSDFMEALWNVWFGEKPVSKDLKKGMLGL